VDYDIDIEIMELPHALRVTPETLPTEVPYLHVPPRACLPVGPVSHHGWESSGNQAVGTRAVPFRRA
jgi:hypothetical protein